MKRLGFIRQLVRRVLDPIPVTALGLFVAGAAWVGLERYAFARMDVVFLVVCLAGLGLLGISVLLVLVGALAVRLSCRATPVEEGPLRFETGQLRRTGFGLPSLRFLPLVQVRWEWERPDEVEVVQKSVRGRLEEHARFAERGEIRGVRRRIVVSDVFGLSRIGFRRADPVVIEVLPHAGKLRTMPVLTSFSGGDERPHPMGLDDGDRVELRRYVPGDPARFIHWKVFGRTRKLMVRMPERALTQSRRTVAYLVSGQRDDASAAAARVALEQDALGGEWIFSADGAPGDATTVPEAVRMVVRSRAARFDGARGLAGFVDKAERAGPASLVCFVPPTPGAWLDRVLAVARKRPQGMRVVIAIDGLDAAKRAPWWKRLLTIDRRERGVHKRSLDAVASKLASLRCDVVIFDRSTGRQLGRRGRGRSHDLLGRAA